MDRLNYHHLLYFFTVAREGSIARASARLGLAQPTVSAQIHTLEDELGRKLLERSGRGLKVTPAGETVLRYAASIFALGGELLNALEKNSVIAPALAVGVSDSLPPSLVAELIGAVARLNPRPRICIVEAPADTLADKVASGALAFALTDAPAGVAGGLQSRVLIQSPIALFAPAAVARRLGRDFPSRLAEVPVAMTARGALRDEVERWLARQKLQIDIVAEIPQPELYASMLGAAVFAPRSSRKWLRAAHGLVAASELSGSRWRAFLISAKGGTRPPAVEAIIAAAKLGAE
jgi:LysR family transcriptional activator of nhaA